MILCATKIGIDPLVSRHSGSKPKIHFDIEGEKLGLFFIMPVNSLVVDLMFE